jgi:hypothetical protein
MALPKLEAARFSTELPISKKKVEYRPFLVREQKILLQALEGEDVKNITNSLYDLIKACVYNIDETELEHIPMTDLEWLFVQIRIQSAGETADLLFPCDCSEEAKTAVTIDLRNCKVTENKANPTIELTKDVGLTLTYPSLKHVSENLKGDGDRLANPSEMFDMVASCIATVWEGEEVHTRDDFSKKELLEFLDTLDTEQFDKVQGFFADMPRLIQKIEFTCGECEKHHERELEGISDFFA